MDQTTYDLVIQFGALGALLAIIPLLKRIDASLSTIAAAVAGVIQGATDAGVQLPEAPTFRAAVAATIRHLRGSVAALLLAGLLVVGCSATADVREGLADLQLDFERYRSSSAAVNSSQAELHDQLGQAIGDHIREAIRRANQ